MCVIYKCTIVATRQLLYKCNGICVQYIIHVHIWTLNFSMAFIEATKRYTTTAHCTTRLIIIALQLYFILKERKALFVPSLYPPYCIQDAQDNNFSVCYIHRTQRMCKGRTFTCLWRSVFVCVCMCVCRRRATDNEIFCVVYSRRRRCGFVLSVFMWIVCASRHVKGFCEM